MSRRVVVSPYDLAERYLGLREVPGHGSHPAILAMLQLDASWPEEDAVPWCSAFVNHCAWLLRLPRSKSLRARSWLQVGRPVALMHAEVGWDVVVLKRGKGNQPGPAVIKAPGHVGFYAGQEDGTVHLLGGNQGDTVSIRPYEISRVLGIRRLA